MAKDKKFLIILIVFVGIFFWLNNVQAQPTVCSQLNQAQCAFVCWPQWCNQPTDPINNIGGTDYETRAYCQHSPCQWTGSQCVETPPGDETSDFVPDTDGLYGDHWVVTYEVVDDCIDGEKCDLYQEGEYQEHYCEESGAAAYYFYNVTQSGVVITEQNCKCDTADCGANCKTNADCPRGSTCQNCTCAGAGPPPGGGWGWCSPEQVGGLVPCGRGCDDPNTTDVNEWCPCTFCHFFVLIERIIDFILFNIVPPLAVLMLVIGGFMFYFAKGEPTKLANAKNILTATITGIVIVYGAFLIISTFLSLIGLATTDFGTDIKEWYKIECEVPNLTNDKDLNCQI